MNLGDLVLVLDATLVSLVAINLKAYEEANYWTEMHEGIDFDCREEVLKQKGMIDYFLSYFGRKLGYGRK